MPDLVNRYARVDLGAGRTRAAAAGPEPGTAGRGSRPITGHVTVDEVVAPRRSSLRGLGALEFRSRATYHRRRPTTAVTLQVQRRVLTQPANRVVTLLQGKDPLVTDLTRSPAPEMAGLAAALAPLGAVLLSTETITTAVETVTALVRETLPGATGAGVTLVDSRGKRSVAASDELVEQADLLQYQLDEGPCLDSWRDRVDLRIDDTTTETRWPRWTPAAAQAGVRSMLSSPLVAGQECVGAIKVYSTQPAAFDARAAHVLALFARQAAVLLANVQTLSDARRTSQQLTDALQTRDVIGQAKGILLARGAADDQAAFAALVALSQHSGTKLHRVARDLVESVSTRSTDHPR